MLRRYILFFLTGCYALHASEYHDQEQLAAIDLARQLPEKELITLAADNPFQALQRENMTSYTKGTAILVPDSPEHAASPRHIDYLRQVLNDSGWYTLSIMVSAQALEADADIQSVSENLQQRMQSAMQQAEQQAGVTIVIAQGRSAALLSSLYAELQLTEPAAFILLGAYLPDLHLNTELDLAIAKQAAPTLDIAHFYDNQYVNHQLEQRKKLAQKHLKAVYRQRQIMGSAYDSHTQQWVAREINGWLYSIGL